MTKKYFKGHLLVFVKIRIAKKCILNVKSWYILRWGRTKPTVCNNKICGPGPSKKMGGSRPIFQCNSAGTLPFFKFQLHFSFSTKSHLIWYVAVLPHSLIFFYSIENAKIQHISSKWPVLKEIDNFSYDTWFLFHSTVGAYHWTKNCASMCVQPCVICCTIIYPLISVNIILYIVITGAKQLEFDTILQWMEVEVLWWTN